jgi:PAS domain S-box-containing protein
MKDSLHVLIVEDNARDAELMSRQLRKGGLKVTSRLVTAREEFLAQLAVSPPDVILSDHALPSFDGFAALQLAKENYPDTPFIFVTGSISVEQAIEAFKRGANDFVLKSQLSTLPSAVRRAVERAERRKTLHEHEAQLRSIVESARHFAIVTTDLQGRVTTWNTGAEHLFGYTADEIIGQDSRIIFTPEDLVRGQAEMERETAMKEGRAADERWHLRKNGDRFWGSGQVMPFFNARGERSGFLKIMQDQTERVRIEEALQKSEELYRSMIQNAQDYAIYLLDPAGRVATWNKGAQRIEGYQADEIIGRHFSIFFTPEDVAKDLPGDELKRARKNGKSQTEGWAVRKDGTLFRSDWTLTPIFDHDGELKAFCKIAHDVTERRRLEEENVRLREQLEQRVCRRTAELEAANKELEAFSYSISHDLRAPLRHILAYVSFLKDTEGDAHESPLYLDKISMSANRMERLIEDLLTFSRMARTELSYSRVNLATVVEGVRMDLCEDTAGRNIEWRIGKMPEVDGDESTLRQVFVNLISNALKYSRGRSPAVIEVGSYWEKDELVSYVRDNGIGFDMHFSQKLFGLFQRLHSDKNYPGTGVGLAIVQRVIRRHGGRVWAEGSVGRGAAFYFTLPKHQTGTGDGHGDGQVEEGTAKVTTFDVKARRVLPDTRIGDP